MVTYAYMFKEDLFNSCCMSVCMLGIVFVDENFPTICIFLSIVLGLCAVFTHVLYLFLVLAFVHSIL